MLVVANIMGLTWARVPNLLSQPTGLLTSKCHTYWKQLWVPDRVLFQNPQIPMHGSGCTTLGLTHAYLPLSPSSPPLSHSVFRLQHLVVASGACCCFWILLLFMLFAISLVSCFFLFFYVSYCSYLFSCCSSSVFILSSSRFFHGHVLSISLSLFLFLFSHFTGEKRLRAPAEAHNFQKFFLFYFCQSLFLDIEGMRVRKRERGKRKRETRRDIYIYMYTYIYICCRVDNLAIFWPF